MSTDPRVDQVKKYITLTKRDQRGFLNPEEVDLYRELGDELAMLSGAELVRLIASPTAVHGIVYSLKS